MGRQWNPTYLVVMRGPRSEHAHAELTHIPSCRHVVVDPEVTECTQAIECKAPNAGSPRAASAAPTQRTDAMECRSEVLARCAGQSRNPQHQCTKKPKQNQKRNAMGIGTRTPLGGGLTQAVRPLESVFHNSGFARVCDLWSVVGGPELNGRTVGHGEKGCQNRPPATANTDRWTCIRAGCTRSGRDAEDRCWQPRPRRTMTR